MTQLHDLLDEVAESYVPDGLARRAMADAGRRRRQRFIVAGAVASVAAVVLAFVVVVEPFTSSSPELIAPASAAPFPAQLPSAQDLRSLAEAPMAAASAAYVVDGEVVLINAATAEAVTAFASTGDLPPGPGGSSVDPSPSSRTVDWDSVALSPDGRQLLMTIPPPGFHDPRGQLLYLLDISARTTRLLQGVSVSEGEGMAGSAPAQLLVWSPSSDEFACVCGSMLFGTPQLQTYRLSDIDAEGRIDHVSREFGENLVPAQISWGAAGIAVQLERPDGPWSFVAAGGLSQEANIASADLLALSLTSEVHFAEVKNLFPSFDQVPFNDGPVWTIKLSDGSDGGLPDRPSLLAGTAVALSASRTGYLVVVRPQDAEPGEPPPPTTLGVVGVEWGTNTADLTQLPLGATSPTFAGNLVSSSQPSLLRSRF